MVKSVLLFLVFFAFSDAYAAIPKFQAPIAKTLKQDLAKRSSRSFDHLLKAWETRYGIKAVDPLLAIASTRSNPDPDRYIALMGVAKLGGKSQIAKVSGFLKDPAWMMRSAALRILAGFENPASGRAVLLLLNDPALVVRLEAVRTVEKLRPAGSEEALVGALHATNNYHAGKAQWIPQRALVALVNLKARGMAPKLLPLLNRTADPELQRQTVTALEALTGKTLKNGKPLQEKLNSWKAELSKN